MDKVTVSAKALKELLSALNGHSHQIREIQVCRGKMFPDNCLDVLVAEYNAAVDFYNELKDAPECK